MNKSTFLARVLGLYFIITSIYTLINYKVLPSVVSAIVDNKGVFFLVAVITLILGLLLVVSHNLWTKDWRVLITVLAWVTLISGIFRLFFFDFIARTSHSATGHPGYMIAITIGFLIIGLFLTYRGFYDKLKFRRGS